MRIRKISVSRLFDIFDQEIPLNLDERITIIHGPNGYGKTVLLRLTNALLTLRYRELRAVPFADFSLDFDDGRRFSALKRQDPALFADPKDLSKSAGQLVLTLTTQQGVVNHTPQSVRAEDLPFPMRMLEHEAPDLRRIGQDLWLNVATQEELSLEEVLDQYSDELPVPKRQPEPDWVKEMRSAIPLRFIETQRLLSFRQMRRTRGFEGQAAFVPAVSKYSEELANAIQAKLTEYASLSQSLDRTFPTRLVRASGSGKLTVQQLRTRLGELEERRSRLMAAGFLDKEQEIDFRDLQRIDESNRDVLSVYVEDVKQKLSVFDELTNKIDLLAKIINERFLYKQLSISKKEGFVFTTPDGKNLSLNYLSSGEQHELVLLYELLFKVGPNTLVLIDEPELSLHVAWQQQFLSDLQEITKLSEIDVLIATHSPQIIHDRWDLTVELQGPKYEAVH